MSDPLTEAGKTLLAGIEQCSACPQGAWHVEAFGWDDEGDTIPIGPIIAAIEAQAVANYRASLADTPSLEGATATVDAQGYVTSIEDSDA